MEEGGFEFRKWASNSVELINKINQDENIKRIESYENGFGYKLGFKS